MQHPAVLIGAANGSPEGLRSMITHVVSSLISLNLALLRSSANLTISLAAFFAVGARRTIAAASSGVQKSHKPSEAMITRSCCSEPTCKRSEVQDQRGNCILTRTQAARTQARMQTYHRQSGRASITPFAAHTWNCSRSGCGIIARAPSQSPNERVTQVLTSSGFAEAATP